MRLLLIVNPTASSVTPRVQAAIVDALSVGHDLVVADTSARGHAASLAREAAEAAVDVAVVLAGDGTLNEAAQGLVGTGTALAPLPGGSTNVFARTIGIAFSPLDACAQLLQSLDLGTPLRIGLGVADDGVAERRFLFHLGAGFDAAAVREMEQHHTRLKRRLAHPAFAVATFEAWIRGYDRDTCIEVESTDAEGNAHAGTGPYVVVSNSDPYTYVGRRAVTIAPDAGLDRSLAVTVFRSLRVPLLARAAASGALHTRFVATSPEIAQFPHIARVTLAGDRAFPWQVDGDLLGDTNHLEVRYEADCLNLVVPCTPTPRRRGRR